MILKKLALLVAAAAVLAISGCSTGIFATNGVIGAGGSVRFLTDAPADLAGASGLAR